MRINYPVLACAVLLALQGCAPFTYLSPDLGPEASAAPVPARPADAALLASVEAMCDHTLRGATRQVLAIPLAGEAAACFATPSTGTIVQGTQPALEFHPACAAGPLGGYRGASGELLFRAFVGARGGVLAAGEAVGTLETDGRIVVGATRVEPRNFLDMPPSTLVEGQLRYRVDGAWLAFAQAAPRFTRTGYLLALSFPVQCDPAARYRLRVTGITIDGVALPIPAVYFSPHGEILPRMD